MFLSDIELWNQSLFLTLNAGADAPAYAVTIARLVANWSVYLAPALLSLVWVRRGRVVRIALLDASSAALAGLGLAQVIAGTWYHPRPFELGLGRQLLDHAAEASFPSDHATLAFSLALPLLLNGATRGLGGVFLSLGIALAWARIYLGVHFPLDMRGALVVAGVACLLIWIVRAPLFRWVYPGLLCIYETALDRLDPPQAVFPRDL